MPIIGWEWRSERITAVAPAGYEADTAVTAAIHTFDPGVIPIWRISVYRAPNEDLFRQFVHHGIGRHYPFFTHLRRPFQVDLPAGADLQDEPNFLDCIFEDVDSKAYLRSGPGDFLPWTWWTYKFCRINWERITQAAWDKRIEKPYRAYDALLRLLAEFGITLLHTEGKSARQRALTGEIIARILVNVAIGENS